MGIEIRNSQRRIRISRRKVENILKQAAGHLSNNYPRRFGMLENCEVSVLLINDRAMRDLNFQYRGIDKPTDVLSFPQYRAKAWKRGSAAVKGFQTSKLSDFQTSAQVLGDIVINLHRAEKQAKEHGMTFYDEVSWLLIHGLLHLLGYDHEKSGYEARKMRKLEEELLGVSERRGK